MKKFLNSNKFKHGTMATVFSALFIAVIVVLNVVVSILGERFPSMDMDLTPDKLNSLSETAVETAKEATLKTEIIMIGTQEQYEGDQLYASYGLKFSQISSIAEKMTEANPDKISYQYVDPDLNPALISQYAKDNLTTGQVLVKSDARYKILTVTDLFSQSQDQNTGAVTSYSMVDGAMANAVHIVNLDFVPVIAVATGHQEMLTADARATFDALVTDNGFSVVEFNILTEEIPEDARILFLSTPSNDYAPEEITKIENFLDVRDQDRTLFVTSHPSQEALPNLDKLLAEWGLKVADGIVVESDDAKRMSTSPTYILGEFTGNFFDEEYSSLFIADASPIELLFDANNDIGTEAIITTSDTAYVSVDGQVDETPETGKRITTAVAYRYNNIDGDNTKTQIMLMGDTVPLLSSYIGNSAFDNRDFIIDALKYTTNTNDDNVGIYVEKTETNILDITAPMATIEFIGFTVFTITVPLIILAIGLVIFLRRRHL